MGGKGKQYVRYEIREITSKWFLNTQLKALLHNVTITV